MPDQPTPASKAPLDILTADQFADLQKTGAKPIRRANTSLNRGGTVDIITLADGDKRTVVAVLRFAEPTAEVKAEVAPLLEAARARLTA